MPITILTVFPGTLLRAQSEVLSCESCNPEAEIPLTGSWMKLPAGAVRILITCSPSRRHVQDVRETLPKRRWSNGDEFARLWSCLRERSR